MHFADLGVSFPELSVKQVNIRAVGWEGGEAGVAAGDLTSMAANVITEFIVPSCTANDVSSTFRLSNATESAISTSDVRKPLCANNSSSRHAVCSDTWNSAGSPSARGHQDTRNGFVAAFRSSG